MHLRSDEDEHLAKHEGNWEKYAGRLVSINDMASFSNGMARRSIEYASAMQ